MGEEDIKRFDVKVEEGGGEGVKVREGARNLRRDGRGRFKVIFDSKCSLYWVLLPV